MFKTKNLAILEKELNEFRDKIKHISIGIDENNVLKSIEIDDFFELWNFYIENNVQSHVLMDSLAYLIIAGNALGKKTISNSICKQVIRNFIPQIYRNLSSEKNILIQSTLFLLIEICQNSLNSTKDLFNALIINPKQIQGFLYIRRKVKNEITIDVRTNTIKFLLGFLQNGDLHVKKMILEIKGLFSSIFSDMKKDGFKLVEYILETLNKFLVQDTHLAKALKISFFNTGILEKLVQLYENKKGEQFCYKEKTVADLVHSFLQDLCLSENGIRFKDLGWYSPLAIDNQESKKKVFNLVLLRFLPSLKVTSDMKQRELFLSILKSCPELVHEFWKTQTHITFEPRASVYYIANVALLANVIDAPIPECFGLEDSIHPPPLENCMSNIMPCVLNRNCSSRVLQLSSRDSRYAGIQILNTCHRKLQSVLELSDSIATKKNQNWSEWKNSLLLMFRQQLPDFQIVISLFSKKDAAEMTDEVDSITYECAALTLLGNYYKWSDDNSAYRFDFGKLLPSDDMIMHELWHKILDVLGVIKDFKWFQKDASQKTYFLKIMALFINTQDQSLRIKASEILRGFLASTFYFRKSDPKIFLDVIHRGYSLSCLQWLESVFYESSKNNFNLVDRTVDFDSKSSFGEFLFPPILLNIIDGLETSNLEIVCFSVEFTLEYMYNTGQFLSGSQLKELLDQSIQNVSSPGFESFRNIIYEHLLALGVTDQGILPSIKWKDYKNQHSDAESIFKYSSRSFGGKWEKLGDFHLYFRIFGVFPTIKDMTKLSGTLQTLPYSWLLSRSFYALEEEIRQKCLELASEKLSVTEKLCALQILLFFTGQRIDSRVLDLISTITENNSILQEIALTHPNIRQAFLNSVHSLQIAKMLAKAQLDTVVSLPYTQQILAQITNSIENSNTLESNLEQCFLVLAPLISPTDKMELVKTLVLRDFVVEKSSKKTLAVCLLDVFEVESLFITKLITKTFDSDDSDFIDQVAAFVCDSRLQIKFEPFFDSDEFLSPLMLKSLVKSPFKGHQRILRRFVRNSIYRANLIFEWIKKESLELNFEQKMNLLISIQGFVVCNNDWRQDVDRAFKKRVKRLCKEIKEEYFNNLFADFDSEAFDLLPLFSMVNEKAEMKQLVNRLESLELKNLSCRSFGAQFRKLYDACHLDQSLIIKLAFSVLKASFKKVKKSKTTDPGFDTLLNELLQSEFSPLETAFTKDFCIELLKLGLDKVRSIELFYKIIQNDLNWISSTNLLSMIATHSQYEQVMQVQSDSKTLLMKIIFKIVEKEPLECSGHEIIAKLCGSYGATLHDSDVILLQILFLIEQKCHIPVFKFIQSWQGYNSQPKDLLDIIDSNIMASSIHWYPFDRDIKYPSLYVPSSAYSAKVSIYDPCFFLPLAANLLIHYRQSIDPHRLVESNILGLSVVAMSSEVLETRKLAHLILYHSFDLINESNIKERNQILLVLTSFRNALNFVDDVLVPVPCTITSFVAQALMILLKPGSNMFQLVNQFCLSRPALDLGDIPMFYSMFYSHSSELKKERNWLILLLLNSINTVQDFKIFQRRHVIEILFGYFSSPISDRPSRRLINEIIFKASFHRSVISNLITRCGLISWLMSCVKDDGELPTLIKLIGRVFLGFIASPKEWDSSFTRLEWCIQFMQLLQIISNHHTLYASKSTIYSYLNLCFIVCKEIKTLNGHFKVDLCRVKSIICFESPAILNGYDEINSFNIDILSHVYEPTPQELLGAFLKLIVIMDHDQVVPVWKYDIKLGLRYILNHWNEIKHLEQLWIWTVYDNVDNLDDEICQLCRCVLILTLQERKTENQVRISELDDWIQYTPTPRYLLSEKSQPDSFKAKLLGQALKWMISNETRDKILSLLE